jgi:hypothetical protein
MSVGSSPLYTTLDSVKVRLANKVLFQADPSTLSEGELPNALLIQLIQDAETHVEQDLCGRYAIPFQSKTFGNYGQLPDHSKRAIRMAVDLKAVMMVLLTDFGRSGHIDGSKYFESQEKLYAQHLALLLGHSMEQADEKQQVTRWRKTPPLADLLLAQSNREADDGFAGMIINTDMRDHDAATYAEDQINNPAAAFVSTRKGGVIR